MSDLPLVRPFERKICRDYPGSIADENEAACKIPSVQARLAYVHNRAETCFGFDSRSVAEENELIDVVTDQSYSFGSFFT